MFAAFHNQSPLITMPFRLELALRMNGPECTKRNSSRAFRSSTPRILITRVLTICHMKLTQSTALEQLEQKRLDFRSLSPVLVLLNLWLLVASNKH